MLTGHTKKLFEEWYSLKYLTEIREFIAPTVMVLTSELYPLSGKAGFYLEFLREQGIIVVIDSAWESGLATGFFYQIIQDSRLVFEDDRKIFPDYNTALTQAIQKCNELINKEK